MIEVHPPEEKIHGFRDFLLHLFTITIGLLIALGLEGAVESWHHHQLRIEATENLHQELEHNQKELAACRAAIDQERSNLTGILKFLDARAASQPYDIHALNLNYTLATMSDASWRTASATGVISYMNYSDVQSYASAYEVQQEFTDLQRDTFNSFLKLQSYVIYGFDPAKITPQQATMAAVDVRQTLSYVQAMDQIGAGLDKEYQRALAGK
jgi:hypothetical protein